MLSLKPVNQPKLMGNAKPGPFEILNLTSTEVVSLAGSFWGHATPNFNLTDM
jgi:hypothetical protein